MAQASRRSLQSDAGHRCVGRKGQGVEDIEQQHRRHGKRQGRGRGRDVRQSR